MVWFEQLHYWGKWIQDDPCWVTLAGFEGPLLDIFKQNPPGSTSINVAIKCMDGDFHWGSMLQASCKLGSVPA